MTTPRRGVPTKQAIAKHHGRSVQCWACDATEDIERAHVVPRGDGIGGSDTDPGNFALLCSTCHLAAPNVSDPAALWRWIDAYRAGVLTEPLDEWVTRVERALPYLGPVPSDENMAWVSAFYQRHPDLMENLLYLAVAETTNHAGERRNDATIAWICRTLIDYALGVRDDARARIHAPPAM